MPAVPAPEPVLPPEPLVAYDIDWFWCDAYGMYMRGWFHAYDRKVEGLSVRIGDEETTVSGFHERTDVLPHFPGAAVSKDCGFEIYAPGPPATRAVFVVDTPEGRFETPVKPPRRELPAQPKDSSLYHRFIEIVNREQLSVLELGARAVGPISGSNRPLFSNAKRYIGMDIHPAQGVDVVGDAHRMSALVGEGAVEALYSVAVLEHLERPWLVAEEMNRALKIGGYVFHSTVHSWPLHEVPNDFWRFSDEGLKVLFGPAYGFEVIDAKLATPVNIYPQTRINGLWQMPLNPGYAEACILSRKVAELPRHSQDGGEDVSERARLYPFRGEG